VRGRGRCGGEVQSACGSRQAVAGRVGTGEAEEAWCKRKRARDMVARQREREGSSRSAAAHLPSRCLRTRPEYVCRSVDEQSLKSEGR